MEKVTGPQLLKEYPAFYRTWRFITTFTSTRHLSLSSAGSIHSRLPHLTSWKSILILSSNQRLGVPSGSFPQVSPPKPCMHFYSPPHMQRFILLSLKKTVIFATNPIKRLRENSMYLDFDQYQRFNNCCLWGDKSKCVVQERTYTGQKKRPNHDSMLWAI